MPGKRPRRKTGTHDIDYVASRCRKCGRSKASIYRHHFACGTEPTAAGDGGDGPVVASYCLTDLGRAAVEKWRPYAISVAVRFAGERGLRPDDAIAEADSALIAIVASHDPNRSAGIHHRLKSTLRLRLIDWVRSELKVRTRLSDPQDVEHPETAFLDHRRHFVATVDDRDEIESLLGFAPNAADVLMALHMGGKTAREVQRDSHPEIGVSGVKERAARALAAIRKGAGLAS